MDSRLRSHQSLIRQYIVSGICVGLVYAIIEYFAKRGSTDHQLFTPLLVRAILAGFLVTFSMAIFEIKSRNTFVQKRFAYILIVRLIFIIFIISFWLAIINAIWQMMLNQFSFQQGMLDYLTDESYLINLLLIGTFLTLLIGVNQINRLHKRGELWNFILGRYHHPREVQRIFCFVDLKGSTAIAERLGHYRFASFLKDYYSDITEALRKTHAEIYQYVGDEIVLSWPFAGGLKNNNAINCFFLMKEIISEMDSKYMEKYKVAPDFRAGLHGGQVMVTWVGEIKKEIVYIGDVLNTTSRIQEDCKRLNKDLLISKELLDQFDNLNGFIPSFVEETTPRGKATKIRLYHLELENGHH